MLTEGNIPVAEALNELLDVLYSVSRPGVPQRAAAARYMNCRTVLLESSLRSLVPGFLLQCASIQKFHDFINLYHPAEPARIAFIEEAFSALQTALGSKPTYDVFDDPHF